VSSSRLNISVETRTFVLERDQSTCQMCGAVSGEPHQDNARQKTRIKIGRILAKSMGGGNDASNLRAVCSICDDGLRTLALDRSSARKLLIQVRRATGEDQAEVLRWLVRKFPQQTSAALGAAKPK
jgi:5-methylcytosine-specific restriction endonuclease McrA